MATKDISKEPQEVVVPATPEPISAPAVTVPQLRTLPGTPTSYVTTSLDISQTIFPPTPLVPPVLPTTVPEVLQIGKTYSVTVWAHLDTPGHVTIVRPIPHDPQCQPPPPILTPPLIVLLGHRTLGWSTLSSLHGHVNHGLTTSIPHPSWT